MEKIRNMRVKSMRTKPIAFACYNFVNEKSVKEKRTAWWSRHVRELAKEDGYRR